MGCGPECPDDSGARPAILWRIVHRGTPNVWLAFETGIPLRIACNAFVTLRGE